MIHKILMLLPPIHHSITTKFPGIHGKRTVLFACVGVSHSPLLITEVFDLHL